jgi:CBS domain-containing membrane protein
LAHIPVVDAGRKVVGIVTQSDMLAALYKRLAMSEAVPRA